MATKIAYLFVFDSLADWEIGFLVAELHSRRYTKAGADAFRVKTFGLTRDAVTTMGGVRILPDVGIDAVTPQEAGLLILPGGDGWLDPNRAEVLRKAEEFLAAGRLVAAICGATVALAGAGFLDHRAHTSNDLGYLKAVCPHYKGEAFYRNEPAVVDGDLVTATGLAPLEFAHRVLGRLGVFGDETLAAWLELYQSRESAQYLRLMGSLSPESRPAA